MKHEVKILTYKVNHLSQYVDLLSHCFDGFAEMNRKHNLETAVNTPVLTHSLSTEHSPQTQHQWWRKYSDLLV